MTERHLQRLPSVSVVIPSLNGARRLRTVVTPLVADAAATEVIVVVDGSTDGSLQLLEALARQDPRVRAIETSGIGANAARQRGLEAAQGDVVLFLDDDIVADPGLVSGHARRHLVREGVVILGYTPVKLDPTRKRGEVARYLYARDYEQAFAEIATDPNTVLRHLWGANVSLRRTDALRVGLWNEEAPVRYHEDRDFGLRCLRAGLVGEFDRSLHAVHLYSRDTRGFLADARAQGEGRALIHRAHRDIVGPLPEDAFLERLPRPLAAFVRRCRRPRVHAAAVAVLLASLAVAGALRAYRLETLFAQLLRRIEQQYGAFAAYADA
jgi:glycosyltransferase involved in cell wall biosynthesis